MKRKDQARKKLRSERLCLHQNDPGAQGQKSDGQQTGDCTNDAHLQVLLSEIAENTVIVLQGELSVWMFLALERSQQRREDWDEANGEDRTNCARKLSKLDLAEEVRAV